METVDFSAKDELFQLVHLDLMDKHDEFFEFLPLVLANKKLSYRDLDRWPLFKTIREDPAYASFREEQKKEFVESTDKDSPKGEPHSEHPLRYTKR